MKDIKIKIRPYNKSNKKDKVAANIMEKMANMEKDKYDGVVREIARIQGYLDILYGITIETKYWESLLNEVIKLNLKNNIERTLEGKTVNDFKKYETKKTKM